MQAEIEIFKHRIVIKDLKTIHTPKLTARERAIAAFSYKPPEPNKLVILSYKLRGDYYRYRYLLKVKLSKLFAIFKKKVPFTIKQTKLKTSSLEIVYAPDNSFQYYKQYANYWRNKQ